MNAVNIGKADAKSYQAMAALSQQSEASAVAAALDQRLVELVKIRASQINGCAFCLRMHTQDAMKHGETADRLSVVAAWWESQYFSQAEQQALTIAERVTMIGHPELVHDAGIDEALTEAQIAAVIGVAVVINAWNRIAISSHYPVAP